MTDLIFYFAISGIMSILLYAMANELEYIRMVKGIKRFERRCYDIYFAYNHPKNKHNG